MLEAVREVHEAHVRRLAGVDPLVRVTDVDVTSRSSAEWSPDEQALVLADVRETDPDSDAALWAEERVVRLQVRAATDRAAAACTDLLERGHRITGGTLTTHVSVASRDTALVGPLVRAGFAPNAVLAVHRLSRTDARPAEQDGAVVVRQAGPGDLEDVVAAHVAVQAFDARLGSLPERPGSERVIRPAVETALRERPGWCWVAERDG